MWSSHWAIEIGAIASWIHICESETGHEIQICASEASELSAAHGQFHPAET